MNENRKVLIKKVIWVVSLAVLVCLFGIITFLCIDFFKQMDGAESFKDYVLSFGAKGILVGFGFQVLQVFVALIPGEIIEIGLGYAFGAIMGTLICFAGLAVGSSIVFILVKKLGTKFLELFFSIEKIENLRFVKKYINNRQKLQKFTFILFILPGTPKDLLTYFLGLTPLSLSEFLCITMIARVPTVVSSTVGGMLVQNGHYIAAVILFAVTALLSVVGWLWYQARLD